jgi:hypothetical protein
MVETNHWSGSGPVRLKDYHFEGARKGNISESYRHDLRVAWLAGNPKIDWPELLALFNVWKNYDLSTATSYGTWNANTDQRDGSPNIEISSMCLPEGATAFNGSEPFTIAHAFIHAGLCAEIARVKNFDVGASFSASEWGSGFQNGPIFVCSSHGERAIQTVDFNVPGGGASSQQASDEFGYFFGSGDSESRADLFCLDAAFYDGTVTKAQAIQSAQQIRFMAHNIKAQGITTGLEAIVGGPIS